MVLQRAGQPTRLVSEVAVGQRAVTAHDRGRVRCRLSPPRHQVRQPHRRQVGRGVVPLVQDHRPFGVGQHVDRADRRRRVGDHLAQHAGEPLRDTVDEPRGEGLQPVVPPERRPLPRHDHQAQRVVVGTVAREPGQLHPSLGRPPGQLPHVERVVLEHQHRVEQRVDAACALDLGQAHVLVREQFGLLGLQPRDEPVERLHTVHTGHADGHGVDEHAHHRLDAGQLGRTPGHRAAEHHLGPPEQPAQHQRPHGLHDRVHGHPGVAGERGECRGGVLVEHDRALRLTGRLTPRITEDGTLVDAVESGPPRGEPGLVVTGRQPLQVVPVARGGRQRVGAAEVQREQLPQEDGSRPAVHDHVVVGDDEPVLARAEVEQREPDQRRPGHVEPALAVGAQPVVHLAGPAGQVDLRQFDIHVDGHDLDRATVAAPTETGPQVGVAAQQRGQRHPEPSTVDLSAQAEHQLGRVGLAGVRLGVEQHPLLQRGQRQNVLDT